MKIATNDVINIWKILFGKQNKKKQNEMKLCENQQKKHTRLQILYNF